MTMADDIRPELPLSHGLSIVVKQTAFVALVVILTGCILAFGGYWLVRETLREQIHQRLELAAAGSQKLVEAYAQRQHERLALIASRTQLRRLIEQHADGNLPDAGFTELATPILSDALKSIDGFLAIAIANRQGKVIVATDDAEVSKDYSQNPNFLRGLEQVHLGLPATGQDQRHALLVGPRSAMKESYWVYFSCESIWSASWVC
jgi:hypothetical protein